MGREPPGADDASVEEEEEGEGEGDCRLDTEKAQQLPSQLDQADRRRPVLLLGYRANTMARARVGSPRPLSSRR